MQHFMIERRRLPCERPRDIADSAVILQLQQFCETRRQYRGGSANRLSPSRYCMRGRLAHDGMRNTYAAQLPPAASAPCTSRNPP